MNEKPLCKAPDGETVRLNDDGLCAEDIDLIRQWFDAVQDLNPKYLERADYLLARRIYEKLNMRVPQSIIDGGAPPT